jgi:hypothetical protein
MRRVCGFLPVLLLAAPLAAQAPAPARTVKLADHLYEITTFAGSPIVVKVLALVGADGVLPVDTAAAETAPAVRAPLTAMLGGTGAPRPAWNGYQVSHSISCVASPPPIARYLIANRCQISPSRNVARPT